MRRTLDQVRVSPDSPAGAESYKRKRVRVLPLVPLLLSGVLLAACSGGADSDSGSSASPTSAKDKPLAFAKCMRENGLEKFPDPGDDGSTVVKKDSGIDPQSQKFKKAEEACKDLSPVGEDGSDGGKPIDAAKGRAWAKCIRDNGVKDFPDPDGATGQVDMTGVGTGGEDPTLDKALETCQDKRPAGITMRQNGGGQ